MFSVLEMFDVTQSRANLLNLLLMIFFKPFVRKWSNTATSGVHQL